MIAPKQDAKADQWSREICTGCTSSMSIADIKARGVVSCCPERRMVSLWDLVSAYDNRARDHIGDSTNMIRASPKGCDVELREAVARLQKAVDQTHDCSVCDGDGEVQRRDPPYGLRKCGGCDAKGTRHTLHEQFRKDIAALINQARQPEGGGQTWSLKNLADREALKDRLTPGHPDAYLNALLDYTGGLFPVLKAAGLKPGEAADVMHHIERAARGLHALTTDNADGLSDDRAVEPFMYAYESVDDGRWKAFPHQLKRADGSICPGRPLFTRPPADKDLAGEMERLRADDCSRFVFVEALARETYAQKHGPSAWKQANDAARRQWIDRTQDAIQRARQALAALGEGE